MPHNINNSNPHIKQDYQSNVDEEALRPLQQQAEKAGRKAGRYTGEAVKKVAKKAGHAAAKSLKAGIVKAGVAIGAALSPYIGIIAIVLGLILIIFLSVWFFFGFLGKSSTEGQLYTSPIHTEADEELVKEYQSIVAKNNRRDIWVVSGEKESGAWYGEVTTDKFIKNDKDNYRIHTSEDIRNAVLHRTVLTSHKSFYEFSNSSIPRDYYGNDNEYWLFYGTLHSGLAINMMIQNLEETTKKDREMIGEDFRPFIYYKKSYTKTVVYSEDADGNPTRDEYKNDIYLIVEGCNLQHHKSYHYEWVTEETETATSRVVHTYEKLIDTTALSLTWERLDNWVKETYEIKEEYPDEISAARHAVWESGLGYTYAAEKLEWLFLDTINPYLLSQSFVPSHIMTAFNKVSEMFGIPEWFLAAIAMKESSLNPDAINEKTGAFGLFQIYGETKKSITEQIMNEYASYLPAQTIELYNNATEKDDAFYNQFLSSPFVNTLAGALVFMGKCEAHGINPSQIDWETNHWQLEIMPALASYGGYVYVPENKWKKYDVSNKADSYRSEKVEAWCYDDYAKQIFQYAERFKVEAQHPLVGIDFRPTSEGGHISSPFGAMRDTGPHRGVDFAVVAGTPIYSISPGIVVLSGYHSVYGNHIIIDHGDYQSLYAHMLAPSSYRVGDEILGNRKIGEVGSTGESTGPHLHFEIRKVLPDGSIQHIDPLTVLLGN